jgi:serine/threonine protein kinase
MAPEMMQEGSYDSAADIWSLGIMAIELAQLHPPHWDVQPVMRALFKVQNCYITVTLLLLMRALFKVQNCYIAVTLLLYCCYIAVTLLLHCCYIAVTLLLHCCY